MDFTYWQDNDSFIGFINQYPDYETQGKTLDELKESLIDLWRDLEVGNVLYSRKIDTLQVA